MPARTVKPAPPKTAAAKSAAKRKQVTAARSATVRQADDDEVLTGPVVDGQADDDGGAHTVDASDPAGRYYRPDRGDVSVAPGLSFTSAPKDREAEGVGEERAFEVDGEVYIARRPVDDSFVLLSTAAASSTPMADRVASILEFLSDVVDEGDQLRLRARMKDPADPFSFTDLLDIMEKVVQTFSRKGPKQARAMARPARR